MNCTVSSASLALLEICSGCRHSMPQHVFFNKMGKAGTEKVPHHRYKGSQEGGILLIWILELTANIYRHDPEWSM